MQLGFFCCTVAADWPLVPRLVAQIQQHHPDCPVVAIGDGFAPPPLGGCTTVATADRLKVPGHVHQYSHRKLALALEHLPDADILVQLDPDCYLRSPLRPVPSAHWFGVPCAEIDRRKWLHGACWGMSASLAELLIETNPFAPELYQGTRPDGSAMEDRGFAEAVRECCPAREWAVWRGLSLQGYRDPAAAVWHPVKEL